MRNVYDNICRVCLSQVQAELLTPLVKDDQLTDHATAVLTFANIEISPKDGLPEGICARCVCLLKQAIVFKLMCEKNHQRLVAATAQPERLKKDIVENSADTNDDDHQTEEIEPDMSVHAAKRTRHKGGPIECDICGKVISSKSALNSHINRKHSEKYPLICEQCGRGFKDKVDLRRHFSVAHGYPKKYACKHCDYKATSRILMKTHMNRHTENRQYKCDHCDKTFYSQQTWRMHQPFHFEKRFACDKCPRKFYRRSDLMGHIEGAHERKHLYRCSFSDCLTAFRKPASVRRHLTSLHGVPRSEQGAIKRIPTSSVRTPANSIRLRPNSIEIVPGLTTAESELALAKSGDGRSN